MRRTLLSCIFYKERSNLLKGLRFSAKSIWRDANRVRRFLTDRRMLKQLVILVLVVGLTAAMHVTFLSNWRPLYGSSTAYVDASSEMYGVFQINMRGYFNASVESISIEPNVPFNYTLGGANQIHLNISQIPSDQVLKITIDRICITNASLSLNYPFPTGWPTCVDVVPPGNINATVINNSVVFARTPFGDREIYGVSYAVNYSKGNGRYVEYPYHWHDFYRIPDFFDLLFLAGSFLLVGVVAHASGWVGRRYPFLTFVLVMVSTLIYLIFGTAYSLIYGRYGNTFSLWTVFVLSPFFHSYYYHIAGNLTLLVPLCLVLESGLPWSSWKIKAGLFFLATYAPALITDLLLFRPIPPGGFGLSFAIIGLGVLYGLIVSKYRIRLFSDRSILIYSLIAGYCLLTTIYGWISSSLTNPLEPSNLGFAFSHLLQLVISFLTLRFALGKIVGRHEIVS